MNFLNLTTLVLLAVVGTRPVFSAEKLSDLETALVFQSGLLAKAKAHLSAAESSLKSNTDAMSRAKLPNDQQLLRGYINVSQSSVDKARSEIFTIQQEVETIRQRILTINQNNAVPQTKVDPGDQVAAAAPKSPNTLVMKDGRRLECVRFMMVEDQYALQMPDKKIEYIKKDDVAEIISH